MSYKLFLDDQRPCPPGFELVSNFDEFKKVILERGVPDLIAFDHDLGDGEQKTPGQGEYTGRHCAQWCVENGFIPKEFSVHSFNPIGAQLIRDIMRQAGSTLVKSPQGYLGS